MLRDVKAVMFDAVGTLIYADPPATRIYHSVGRRHGSRLSEREVESRFARLFKHHQGKPQSGDDLTTNADDERRRWKRIVQGIFCDALDPSLIFDELWRHFAQPTSWALYDDVDPVWNAFLDQGIRVGVASNFDARLNFICQQLHPLRRTKNVFHSAGLGCRKPAREFFRRIQRSLKLAPHQLVMVGDDHDADFLAARHAGWHSFWLRRHGVGDSRSQLSNLGQLPRMIAAD